MVPKEPQEKGRQLEEKPDTRLDPFVIHSIFPDASAVFTCRPSPLAEAKDTACIVLDTNALLIPYGLSAQRLSEIEATYQRLLKESRLAIPAQVAREFARNRVGKLAELYQGLSRRRSQLHAFRLDSFRYQRTFKSTGVSVRLKTTLIV